MESLEREEPHSHHYGRRRRQRRNQTGAARRKFLVAVFVVGNHAAYALEGNGDRSSSSSSSRSTSFGGMPSRKSLQKNRRDGNFKPADNDRSTARDKKEFSKISESSQRLESSILSSPFLDSFQEQVHAIVSEYRSEVRSTFQELAHDMMYHRERKMRQQAQRQRLEQQERRDAQANGSATASASTDEEEEEEAEAEQEEEFKELVADDDVDDEQGAMDGKLNADWDDEMDATLFAPETVDLEPPFEQERFDVFSDLAGDGTTDEVDNDLVVGDTDEEYDSVLGRLEAQSGLSQETSQSRSDVDSHDDEAVELLKSELVHSVEEKTTKKKKKKKKKSKKGKRVAEIRLEASDSNEDKLPFENPSSGVSDLVAAPMDMKNVAKVLRSMTSTVFFVIMYVLTALLIKALTNVLKPR
jgi:hypothetical protein